MVPSGQENATAMASAAAAATVSSAAATGTETTDGRKRVAVVEVLLRTDDGDSGRKTNAYADDCENNVSVHIRDGTVIIVENEIKKKKTIMLNK